MDTNHLDMLRCLRESPWQVTLLQSWCNGIWAYANQKEKQQQGALKWQGLIKLANSLSQLDGWIY